MTTLIFRPKPNAQVELNERYRKFQFGNGYQQRQKEGVNPFHYNVSVVFQFSETGRLTIANADADNANTYPVFSEWTTFFADHGYTTPFEFDCPGIGKKTFIINSCSASHISGDLWEVSVEMETFNLASALP